MNDEERDRRALAAPTPEELERLRQFSEWLDTTNAPPTTINGLPQFVRQAMRPKPHSCWLDKRPGWLNLTANDRRFLRAIRIKGEPV